MAQTPTANVDGSYTVPRDWALKPSGLNPGDRFRLLFKTSTTRNAQSTNIADYNTHVQTAANLSGAHSAIKSYASTFKVLGCTASTDAHANTGTTKSGGVPIYWLNGNKLADNYADFYDGSWDDRVLANTRDESGAQPAHATWPWTGCEQDGDSHSDSLGSSGNVRRGASHDGSNNPISHVSADRSTLFPLYAMSPVFEVGAEAPPEAYIGMWAVRNGDAVDDTRIAHVEDAGALTVRVGHAQEPERTDGVGYDLTFNYYVRDSGGWHAQSGFKTAVLPANQPYVDLTIPIRENSDGGDGDTTVNILLMGGKGYLAAHGNLTYDIQDGPDTGLSVSQLAYVVWIVADSAGEDRTEGEDLTFQIRLGGPTVAQVPFTVHLKVEESGGGDFVAAGDEGRKTVRVERGQSSVGFRVPTAKDGERELDSRVTVSLTDAAGNVPGTTTLVSPGGGGSYIVSTEKLTFDSVPPPPVPDSIQPYQFPPTASVTVVDLNPQREVSFASGSPLEVQENDQDWVNLTVNVVPPPAESFVLNFSLSGTATFKSDYDVLAGLSGNRGSLRVPANAGSVTVPVKIIDDSIEDDGETIVVRLLDSGRYEPSDPDSVTLTIRNHDGVPGTPEITVAAGADVTEGGDATFTLTADPAPTAPLDVSVTIAAEGAFGITAGQRTVTIPVTGSHELTLATDNDGTDEPDGSVTATVTAGTGYTVGATSSDTVGIADDDAPVTPVVDNTLPAAHPVVKHASLVKSFYDRITARHQHGDSASGGWNKRFLKAMGHPDYVDYPQAAVTVADATRLWNHGGPGANTAWDGTVAAVTYAEQYFAGQVTPTPTPDPVPVPEIAIAAGAGVTEGGDATFTLTATPPPAAPLEVTVTVAVEGAFGITAGERTVTIPTTGSHKLTLTTDNDGTDEANGSVTATVDAGAGYTVGTASTGTVAIADDDLPVPVVSIAAGAGVTEGTAASFVLTATPPPAAALEVTVTVAASGDYGIAAGERTVTIPTTGSYTLTLATTGDEADEPDGSVTATVDAGTGYTVGAASSGTVPIADDDLPPPAVSVAAKVGSITEGGDAVFTVTADRAVDANLAVTLNVTEAAGSDFVAAADEGAKTVTILAGKTSAALTVKTDDDTVDEPDGSVTATVAAGDGYTVGAASSGTVAVADNDAAGRPMVTVEDATAREGQTMQFAVRLSAAAKRDVWVRVLAQESNPVSARASRDFQGPYYSSMVRIRAGQTVGQFGVRIHDDSHDDGGETFEAHVLFVMNDVAGIADGVAVGTIENDDPLPAAYLARFGRTVAEQALDGIAGRMSADRTPGMQGTVAGQSLSFDPAGGPDGSGAANGHAGMGGGAGLSDNGPGSAFSRSVSGAGGTGLLLVLSEFDTPADRFGGDHGPGEAYGLGESRTMTARDALLGSSFSLTGEQDGAGGSLAFWGRAAQGSFDGVERGDGTDIRLDGTVTTGMLGADYAWGDWLIGLALTQSASEGEYAALGGDPCPDTDSTLCDGAVRAGDGKVEASLTAAIPYAALEVSERLKLWGSAGYGSGEVTLKTAMGDRYSADTSWTMAAAGLRGDLLEAPMEGSGPALALTSDALWARTSSEKTRDLAASESDVTRLRLGLEGRYRLALEGDGHLTPKLELGARHDGGDAETGFGVELGGGFAWVDPVLGLSLDVSGRTLLAHEDDDLEDRGVSAALAFDPAPATGRGLSLSLRQDFGGQASGGLDALFNPAPLEDRTGSEAASRWTMEATYGVPAFGGRFTGSPHVGLGLATGARDYSLGWRLTPEGRAAPDLSLGVKATRRESDAAAPEHTVGVEATMRW